MLFGEAFLQLGQFRLAHITNSLLSLTHVTSEAPIHTFTHQPFTLPPTLHANNRTSQPIRFYETSSTEMTISTFSSSDWPLQTQTVAPFPDILKPRIVMAAFPTNQPTTAQTNMIVSGMHLGVSDHSGRVRTGATACASRRWLRDRKSTRLNSSHSH